MRRLYIFLFLMGLSIISFGQTYLLEDFSNGSMPPAGWTIENLASQWSINNGNSSGGTAPEAKFTYTNGVTTSRLISPVIDLTGLTTVSFEFKHFYDWYANPAPVIGVATRSGGGNWNQVWQVAPVGNVGPQTINMEINNSDVGASDFQLCFYLNGNMYNLDYWYIDDIWLFQQLELDAGLTQITTPPYLGEAAEVTGIIKGFGSNPITDLEIGWQVDDGPETFTTFSGLSIGFGNTYPFTCNGMIDLPIGSYTLKVWIESVNGGSDGDPSNDLKEMPFSWVSRVVDRIPCFEEFTSSTCGPCATLNTQFVPWCEAHADQIRLLKYQMNWPGAGDPYYTAEGGVRRDYYGVNAVPAVFVNGDYIGYVFSAVQPAFENALLQPGLMSLVSSHELNGTNITVNATVLPYADFTDFRMHIAVFEFVTTQNVATNGETEFHHVMMKMIPNANGTTTNLTDRVPFTVNQTVDLSETNVEEWDDLGVIVFLQHFNSKEIFQSEYSVENGIFGQDASLMMLTFDGEPVPGFSPDILEYTVTLPSTAVEIPVVEAVTNDANAFTIVVPATELPGTTTVDVFAEDLATYQTYSIHFDLGTGMINPDAEAIQVYPNPNRGQFYITGAANARITVYNTSGAEVAGIDKYRNEKIDLGGLDEGIYFLNILMDDKTPVIKKISIIK